MSNNASLSGPLPRVIELKDGLLLDNLDPAFPSTLRCCVGSSLDLPAGATHYGYVSSGSVRIHSNGFETVPHQGLYFSIAGSGRIEGHGSTFVVSRNGYRGISSLCGPIEDEGRLRYIDGCSDTVLISPLVLGDPCLNLLVLPPGTRQTPHTHPSVRVGLVVGGRGVCRPVAGPLELNPNSIFILPPDAIHNFDSDDESITIVAYHPDSDCGPSDSSHPMLNRTMVDGVSATERRRRDVRV